MPREQILLDEVRAVADRLFALDDAQAGRPFSDLAVEEQAVLSFQLDWMRRELRAIDAVRGI